MPYCSALLLSYACVFNVGRPTQVPHLLLSSGSLSSDPVTAFGEAMFACNEQLRSSAIDDSLSGTTAIACLVRGRTVYVANVGDSRYVQDESMMSFVAWAVQKAIAFPSECKNCSLLPGLSLLSGWMGKFSPDPFPLITHLSGESVNRT